MNFNIDDTKLILKTKLEFGGNEMKAQGSDIKYRIAKEEDIESVCNVVKATIAEMEKNNIFQWDNIYPTRDDFLSDVEKQELFIGVLDNEIAVVYAINNEYDEQYENGIWKYPDCEYRIIHRFCVSPKYQNRGLGRNTLSHIEDTLREAGVETIRLDVFCNNPFALSLYHNSGYEKVGVANWRKGIFFLMEKHL